MKKVVGKSRVVSKGGTPNKNGKKTLLATGKTEFQRQLDKWPPGKKGKK